MAGPVFLSARQGAAPGAAAAVLGAPFDGTSSHRGGSREGPVAIRRASDCLETYSPLLDRDLGDLDVVDLGDVEWTGPGADPVVAAVEAGIAGLPRAAMPVLLGGEHTVTLGAVRALLPSFPDLAVLQIDAHLDLRDEYLGTRVGHATVMRRVTEVIHGPLVQLGIRSGTREEFAAARGLARHTSTELVLPAPVYAEMARRPVYLTVDIDVVDPAFAPGTDSPEPAGPSAADLLNLLRSLRDLPVVGFDVVEVAPSWDPGGATAVLAAKVVRECLLLFAARA